MEDMVTTDGHVKIHCLDQSLTFFGFVFVFPILMVLSTVHLYPLPTDDWISM